MTTTIQMIKESIAMYNQIITDAELLGTYFEQGDSFFYEVPLTTGGSDYYHAYPGIWEGQLMFFVIPEAYDKPEYASTIDQYTQACPVSWGLMGSHTIPAFLAIERMDRWGNNYKSWISAETKKTVGMFKAFAIPSDDLLVGECIITLGLQLLGSEGLMTADLIAANVDTKALIQFDDFSTPVPPFTSVLEEGDFYLLDL